ncbi:MAG: YdiU family protein [Oscillatoriales cyanobacterium]|nr:MAG: YdiU family protein [Oscillatoriales cyanobacterium]
MSLASIPNCMSVPNAFLRLDYEPAFQSLGDDYFDWVAAAEFPQHDLRFRNDALLPQLGLDPATVTDQEFIAAFGQFQGRESFLAMRYHGYQFGEYNPRLGDGRGFLYGQIRGQDGLLYDLATKGSGQTPYSRNGDGRLTLKGGVREVLATEMLARLGVNTSRTLVLVETGEKLWRGDEPSPTRSSVIVRMGQSHIRFGTFERLHYLNRPDLIDRLLTHVVALYYPHLIDRPDWRSRFYEELVDRVALLCAQWMAAGFCHAVLNTDNMLVTGQSFDYGPYAFLPTYDPTFTAAYFDYYGRYAYGNQPTICRLNLELLQKPLGMVTDPADLVTALEAFADRYQSAYLRLMTTRLGFGELPTPEADDLVEATLQLLSVSQMPYHRFFETLRSHFEPAWRDRPELYANERPFWVGPSDSNPQGETARYWAQWCDRYGRLLQQQSTEGLAAIAQQLCQANATITIVRPEIERVWEAIDREDDWQPFNALLAAIAQP